MKTPGKDMLVAMGGDAAKAVGGEIDPKIVEQRKEVARLEAEIESAQRKYEATIREHLEKNNRLVMDHNLKRMPELYANVRAWQDMLEPVLKEQHGRPNFDIFRYGQDILAGMGPEGGEPVLFADLVAGAPRWEICRRFLTCLVLTNHGNTDIVVNSEEDRFNSFSVRLINAQKELPSLEDDPDEAKKQKAKKGKKGGKPLADQSQEVLADQPQEPEEEEEVPAAKAAKKSEKASEEIATPAKKIAKKSDKPSAAVPPSRPQGG